MSCHDLTRALTQLRQLALNLWQILDGLQPAARIQWHLRIDAHAAWLNPAHSCRLSLSSCSDQTHDMTNCAWPGRRAPGRA